MLDATVLEIVWTANGYNVETVDFYVGVSRPHLDALSDLDVVEIRLVLRDVVHRALGQNDGHKFCRRVEEGDVGLVLFRASTRNRYRVLDCICPGRVPANHELSDFVMECIGALVGANTVLVRELDCFTDDCEKVHVRMLVVLIQRCVTEFCKGRDGASVVAEKGKHGSNLSVFRERMDSFLSKRIGEQPGREGHMQNGHYYQNDLRS